MGLIVTLLCLDYKVEEVEKISYGKCVFCFKFEDSIIANRKLYFNKEMMIEPHKFLDSIKLFKQLTINGI